MKKKLNIDIIQSELRGGSAFFPGYKKHTVSTPPSTIPESQSMVQPAPAPKSATDDLPTPPPPSLTQKTFIISIPATQGVPPPVPRTVPRTVPRSDILIPKSKRMMKQRQPFDIYEDQYARLKQIANSERGFLNGRGMSQMVREAIDAYLVTQRNQDTE